MALTFVIQVSNNSYEYLGHLIARHDGQTDAAAICGFQPTQGWYEPDSDSNDTREVACSKCTSRLSRQLKLTRWPSRMRENEIAREIWIQIQVTLERLGYVRGMLDQGFAPEVNQRLWARLTSELQDQLHQLDIETSKRASWTE
jgi:hypothetical protein